jgi:hypothetical protein
MQDTNEEYQEPYDNEEQDYDEDEEPKEEFDEDDATSINPPGPGPDSMALRG